MPILPLQAVPGLTVLERALMNFITLLFVIFVGDRWIIKKNSLYLLQTLSFKAPASTGAGFLRLVATARLLLRHLHLGRRALLLGGRPRHHVKGGDGPGMRFWKFSSAASTD